MEAREQPPLADDSVGVEHLSQGVDELNLVEFPLAAITDRIIDGKKTIILDDSVFDRVTQTQVDRRLTISGSDRYGLPTAKDEDVLLACLQISKLCDFRSREVTFSRYEMLKLLRWPDESRNYRRLTESLRRWKGITVYSERAFYDHAAKSWVNRDFGIFDTLHIYHRDADAAFGRLSRFSWNEVLFDSFQAGYLKRLDWDLYTRLKSPIAKRLYRLLDKRFYRCQAIDIDLHDLAWKKLRLSASHNVAQIKRCLMTGIEELEQHWDLRPLSAERRFVKLGKGNWIVRFHRKRRTLATTSSVTSPPRLDSIDTSRLEQALIRRHVGPAMAEELVRQHPSHTIQTMLDLFDWYNQRGQQRHAGFLVMAIRSPESITMPRGFESSVATATKRAKQASLQAEKQAALSRRERESHQREQRRVDAFHAYWAGLSPEQQDAFETEAINAAEPVKRKGYYQYQGRNEQLFEQYRTLLLRDHFERIHQLTNGSAASSREPGTKSPSSKQ